ncbi:MAG: zinc ribbon domain-containing protein [Planctomycetota bacterium]
MEEKRIDPGHGQLRNVFRVLGPLLAITGVILIVVAIVSLFSAFGTGEPPRYFWCFFAGAPIWFVGMVLCKFGYMGKVARYVAGEIAPVGKDTINYMAEGTKDSIKTVARAIGEGLGTAATGEAATKVRCHKCNNLLEEEAKFCSACGSALGKTKACPKCNELNDPDAKFCDNCGFGFG